MKLQELQIPLILLTPALVHGADPAGEASLRVPAVRGMLRTWHRQLGLPDCGKLWGSASDAEPSASMVAVQVDGASLRNASVPVLPHKENPKHRGSRSAVMENQKFAVRLRRLPGCDGILWDRAWQVLNAWAILGNIGQRSARAAGSIWPEQGAPESTEKLTRLISDWWPNRSSKGPAFAIIGGANGDLRTLASDTVKGPPGIFGSAQPRTPSSIQFKVICPGAQRLLLVRASSTQMLQEAERLLKNKPDSSRWRSTLWSHL